MALAKFIFVVSKFVRKLMFPFKRRSIWTMALLMIYLSSVSSLHATSVETWIEDHLLKSKLVGNRIIDLIHQRENSANLSEEAARDIQSRLRQAQAEFRDLNERMEEAIAKEKAYGDQQFSYLIAPTFGILTPAVVLLSSILFKLDHPIVTAITGAIGGPLLLGTGALSMHYVRRYERALIQARETAWTNLLSDLKQHGLESPLVVDSMRDQMHWVDSLVDGQASDILLAKSPKLYNHYAAQVLDRLLRTRDFLSVQSKHEAAIKQLSLLIEHVPTAASDASSDSLKRINYIQAEYSQLISQLELSNSELEKFPSRPVLKSMKAASETISIRPASPSSVSSLAFLPKPYLQIALSTLKSKILGTPRIRSADEIRWLIQSATTQLTELESKQSVDFDAVAQIEAEEKRLKDSFKAETSRWQREMIVKRILTKHKEGREKMDILHLYGQKIGLVTRFRHNLELLLAGESQRALFTPEELEASRISAEEALADIQVLSEAAQKETITVSNPEEEEFHAQLCKELGCNAELNETSTPMVAAELSRPDQKAENCKKATGKLLAE